MGPKPKALLVLAYVLCIIAVMYIIGIIMIIVLDYIYDIYASRVAVTHRWY